MDEQTLDIYDIVTSKANGRYFIVNNQVYSHEQQMETKVTFYGSFRGFLKGFLTKILDCYGDPDRKPAKNHVGTQDGVVSFLATYDCDHSDDYYVDLRTSYLNEEDLLIFVNHLNLSITARGSNILEYELERLNKSLSLDYEVKKPTPEKYIGESKTDSKARLCDSIRFHMIIPFLEAGKEPLSEIQQTEFLIKLDTEIEELLLGLSNPFMEYLIHDLIHELSFTDELKLLAKNQPDCWIGSKEWIGHHKQYMQTYHHWKDYKIYQSGLLV